MISYDESQKILAQVAESTALIGDERVAIENAVGRILSQNVYCRENNPPFDNSAMDGFALKLDLLLGTKNILDQWLPVSELIAAGDAGVSSESGLVIEIMTGAPIPSNEYTSVIKIEDVDVRSNFAGQKEIKLTRIPSINENIRRSGEDSKIGDVLLKTGTVLNSLHLMILSTQGIVEIPVRKKIKIAIVSTGKELIDYQNPTLKPGQIRNSTAIFLKQELNSALTEIISVNHVMDDPEIYLNCLKEILYTGADIIISTGAVSMGVFDFVRPALENLGAHIHFHKCAIRPGKPILFATLTNKGQTRFIFGVPGNPVSTAVGYTFFVKPFIHFLLKMARPVSTKAKLVADVKKPEGFKCFFKADLNESGHEAQVTSLDGQASFMVSPFQKANAWLVLPETGNYLQKNTEVEVIRL